MTNKFYDVHRIVSITKAFQRQRFYATKIYIAHLLKNHYIYRLPGHLNHIFEIKEFDHHQWKQNTCPRVR